jgi:hypothetical protein
MHGISREEQMHIHEQVREFRTFHEERARLEGHGVPGRPGERMQLARMPGHESLAKQLPPAAREKLAHPTTAVAAHPTAPVAGRPVAPVPGKPATAKPATAAKPKPKDSKDSNSR